MSAADLAVIAIAVVSLAHVAADYGVRMKVADRMRLVSPPAAKRDADPAASGAGLDGGQAANGSEPARSTA